MSKFKAIVPIALSNLRKAGTKLYSKTAQQLEPAANLRNDLDVNTEKGPTKSPTNPLESNLAQSGNKVSEQKSVSISSAAKKPKPKGCNKNIPPKGKKGKKCGQPKPPQKPQDPGPPGGFYIVDKCDMYDIPKTNSKKWRTISYALLSFVMGLSAFVFTTMEEKAEPEYIPYEYMYKRTKRFPWRDGKTSLFHGPNNLIPEEEEERLDKEAEEKTAPGVEKGPRYKKRTNEIEEKLEKRKQHAQEELEKRKKRHEAERNQNEQ